MDLHMTLLTYSLQQARLRWSFSGGITMTQSQTSVVMMLKCTGPSELIFIHTHHTKHRLKIIPMYILYEATCIYKCK